MRFMTQINERTGHSFKRSQHEMGSDNDGWLRLNRTFRADPDCHLHDVAERLPALSVGERSSGDITFMAWHKLHWRYRVFPAYVFNLKERTVALCRTTYSTRCSL